MTDEPLLSVCQLSLPDTTFEQDLELIRASAATGVAIAESKLRDGEEEQQVAALIASGLTATVSLPTNIAPLPLRPPYIFPGPEDPDARLELMLQSIRRLARFKPDCITVITGSSEGYSLADARKIALDSLRKATKLADELGTRLAPESNRNLEIDFSFLRTIPETVDFLDEIDNPGIGFCYDFYHLWDQENLLEDTVRVASRIFGVQHNDWRAPRCAADRAITGQGVMNIPAMLRALERGGYRGWYDFEIFSDDGRWGTNLPDSLWKMPYDQLIGRANSGLLKAWYARREGDSP